MTPLLKLAKKVASKSDCQHRHCAMLFRGGALLAVGFNHDGRHAEDWVINKLWPNKRAGTTLFSYRLTRAGKIGLAKPCLACTKLIKETGIKKVYYTLNDGSVELLKITKNGVTNAKR